MALDLVNVDKAKFYNADEIYFLLEELDQRNPTSATKGNILPETISEAMACYALGFQWNKGSGGDAINGDEIEPSICRYGLGTLRPKGRARII